MPMTPDSPECYEQIRQWIAECEAIHPRCKPRGRELRDGMVPLPTRVVWTMVSEGHHLVKARGG